MAKTNTTPAPANNGTTTNKADAVRSYHQANPTARPTEISKALAKQGIDVQPADA